MNPLDALKTSPKAALDNDSISDRTAVIAAKQAGNPTTALGAIFSDARKNQLGAPLKVNPNHVRRGPHANRLPDYFDTESFFDLKRRIQETGGNQQPALVVETQDRAEGNTPIYEIVYGHCRHQACLELSGEEVNGVKKDYPYLAHILPFDTPVATLATLTRSENAGRSDTTQWEDAIWYKDLLDTNVFSSARQIAFSMGEPESSINRLVRIARDMDQDLIQLLSDQRNLQLSVAEKSIKLKAKQPQLFHERLAKIKAAGKKFTCKELFAPLLAPVEEVNPVTHAPESLLGKDGQELGQYKRTRQGMRLDLNFAIKPEGLQKLAELISKYKD